MSKNRNLDDDSFTLFIILPLESVCTLRGLRSGVTAHEVKGRIEIAAGIPSHIYTLAYPDGECLGDKERLLKQENVRDGYLLRIQLHEAWEDLYFAVSRNNTDHVYHGGGVHLKNDIYMGSEETTKVDLMVYERATTALYVASYLGLTKMCNMLLSLGLDVNGVTRFGRSAVHAAVCKDHVVILNMLIAKGSDVSIEDVYDKTALDLARTCESYQCERRLRLASLNLRGLSQGFSSPRVLSQRKFRVSSVPNKVLSLRNPSPSQERPKAKSASVLHRKKPISPLLRFSSDNVTSNGKFISCKTENFPQTTGYWIVSQNSARNKKQPENSSEQTLVNSNSRAVSATELALPNGKFRIMKFRKDSKDMTADFVADSSEISLPSNAPKIHTPVCGTKSCEEKSTVESKNENEANGNQTNQKIEVNGCSSNESNADSNSTRKSSFKSDGPRQKKSVHFSAKARSLKNLPRPETMESFRQMKRRINIAASNPKSERSTHSAMTHELWLRRKKQIEKKNKPLVTSSSDDDDSENDRDNDEAFKEWLRRKREGPEGPPRHPTGNRPVPGLIKVGSTAAGDGRNPDPVHNIKAYREWLHRRQKFRKGPNVDRMKTMQNFMEHKQVLEEKRQELLLTAISYDDWMDHSEERNSMIRKILRADMEQLKAIEQSKLSERTPHQITHSQWKYNVKKRQAEEKLRLEMKQKAEEKDESSYWKNGRIRSSAAIPYSEWLKQKGGGQAPQSDTDESTYVHGSDRPKYVHSPRESTYGYENTRKEAEISYSKYNHRETESRAPEIPNGHDIINPLRHRRVAEIASC